MLLSSSTIYSIHVYHKGQQIVSFFAVRLYDVLKAWCKDLHVLLYMYIVNVSCKLLTLTIDRITYNTFSGAIGNM